MAACIVNARSFGNILSLLADALGLLLLFIAFDLGANISADFFLVFLFRIYWRWLTIKEDARV